MHLQVVDLSYSPENIAYSSDSSGNFALRHSVPLLNLLLVTFILLNDNRPIIVKFTIRGCASEIWFLELLFNFFELAKI